MVDHFFQQQQKESLFFFSGQGSVLYICTYSSRVVFTFVHTILLYHSINNLILLTTFQPSDCYMFGADWHPPSAVRRKYWRTRTYPHSSRYHTCNTPVLVFASVKQEEATPEFKLDNKHFKEDIKGTTNHVPGTRTPTGSPQLFSSWPEGRFT